MRPRSTLRLAAGAVCLGVAFALYIGVPVRLSGRVPGKMAFAGHSEAGEILRHGIHARADLVSYRMPLATLVSARLDYHCAARLAVLVAVQAALVALLVFALGALLGPYGTFIGAASVVVLSGQYKDPSLYPDAGYILLVLLSAGLLVWRARSPSLQRSVLFAASVGASLLWRSPLALLPPALAFYEWGVQRRFSLKGYRGQLLVLCVVPYLFLAPWIAMNWTIHRQLVVFEHDAAAANVVTGALGIVKTTEADARQMLEGRLDAPGGVLGWAAREVLSHPLRFTRAFFLRLKFALGVHPLLALLAACGLWAFRKSPEHRAVGLMAAYFLGIHCLMSVDERYFLPVWPLLALLACSLPAAWLPGIWASADGVQERAASWIFKATLAPLMLLALYSQAVVFSFARGVSLGSTVVEDQLDSALRSHAGDAWLLSERGAERFGRGEFAGAAEDFNRAAAQRPESPALQLRRAHAEALGGDPSPLLSWRPPAGDAALEIDAGILKAIAYIRLGRPADARPLLKAAHDVFEARNLWGRATENEHERQVETQLRSSSDNRFLAHCRALQGPRPAAEMLALIEEIARVTPAFAEISIERAELAAKAGRRKEALKSLEQALSLQPDARALLRLAVAYGELGDLRKGVALSGAAARKRAPVSSRAWFVNAELSARLGRRAEALEALGRAEQAGLDDAHRRLAVPLYRELEAFPRAYAVVTDLVRRFPSDTDLLLERARLALRLGKRDEAAEALARARARRPDSKRLLEIERLYRELDEPGLAERRGDVKPAEDPKALLERAEAAARATDKKAALRSLERARRLKADAETALRIAELYAELGQAGPAFELSAPLMSTRPNDARVWLLRGEAAGRLGRRAEALEALARARPGAEDSGEESLRRLALAYQGLAEYGRALEIFTALTRRHPDRATVFSDKALCEHLMGSEELALSDLRTAIRLDPKFLPAYLTLGSIHTGAGRFDEAVKVYDQALAGAGAHPLREVLVSARREARAKGSK